MSCNFINGKNLHTSISWQLRCKLTIKSTLNKNSISAAFQLWTSFNQIFVFCFFPLLEKGQQPKHYTWFIMLELSFFSFDV